MEKELLVFGSILPILDGSNYDYWKPRMVEVIKSMDNKAWRAVERGWKHPENFLADGTIVLILETKWSKYEEELALGNSKALIALFNGIDKNIFILVQHCELDKEAWDILKTAHVGTS